jgi:hypothetical protein
LYIFGSVRCKKKVVPQLRSTSRIESPSAAGTTPFTCCGGWRDVEPRKTVMSPRQEKTAGSLAVAQSEPTSRSVPDVSLAKASTVSLA